MMTDPRHPQLVSEWVPADDSTYTLEFAATTRPGVVAMRDSFDQRDIIFATDKQLMKLAEAVHDGRIKNLFS